LRCGDCGYDKRVAFSCKQRGFWPSCSARRMAQTAAYLVDHFIPRAPVRQCVLCLPIPLRLLLAAQPELVTPVLQVVHRVITRHMLGQAGLKADEADSGSVTLIQRFGSAANLNIHLHCLVLDGVYRLGTDGTPEFVEVLAPARGSRRAASTIGPSASMARLFGSGTGGALPMPGLITNWYRLVSRPSPKWKNGSTKPLPKATELGSVASTLMLARRFTRSSDCVSIMNDAVRPKPCAKPPVCWPDCTTSMATNWLLSTSSHPTSTANVAPAEAWPAAKPDTSASTGTGVLTGPRIPM